MDPLPDALPSHDLATLRAAFAQRERELQQPPRKAL
jgi:hypothetical protein